MVMSRTRFHANVDERLFTKRTRTRRCTPCASKKMPLS
jgi:hypothetical protein